MSDVVVVESPAKAKTINRYLGGGYTVLASMGHVRDLPPKDGSVRPEQDFAMDWQSDARGEKHVGAIAKALKGASTLYLATDPDREGEAISWHVKNMLSDKKVLKGVKVRRITFNEITRNAVRYAMAHPRDLDQPLIEAYLARRALDYLVGFTLSPVLWRKLPGSVWTRPASSNSSSTAMTAAAENWQRRTTSSTAVGEVLNRSSTCILVLSRSVGTSAGASHIGVGSATPGGGPRANSGSRLSPSRWG